MADRPKAKSSKLQVPYYDAANPPSVNVGEGSLAYNDTTDTLEVFTNGSWTPVGGGGGGGAPTGPAGGDLGGTYPNPSVEQITGIPVGTLVSGQVLRYDGTEIDTVGLPTSLPPSGAAGGDLAGTYPNPTVTQARGLRETAGPTTLAMGAVANGQMLVRSGTTVIGQAVPTGGGPPTGAAGGDLSGTYPNPTVDGILNVPVVDGGTFLNGRFLQYTDDGLGNLAFVGAEAVVPSAGSQTAGAIAVWTANPNEIDDAAITITANNINMPSGGTVDGRDISVDAAAFNAHIANTSNPHVVTATQVGLGNVTNDAQLKRSANDYTSFTSKATLDAADVFLMESSTNGFAKRQVTAAIVNPFAFGSKPLYLPPGTANAFDIEGDSDPGWTYRDFTNNANRTPTTGTVPSYTGTLITSSTAVPRASFGTQRKSWIRLQIPQPGTTYEACYHVPTLQTPTLPIWYWCRIGTNANVGNNPSVAMLGIFNNASGVPDKANFMAVGQYFPGSGSPPTFQALQVAETRTSISFGAADQLFGPIEYFAIYKTSTAAKLLGIAENGSVYEFASIANSNTSFWIGVYMANNTTNHTSIIGIDFIRASASNEPWLQG